MFAEVLLKRLFLLFGASTFSSEVLTPRLPAGFFVGLRPWGGVDVVLSNCVLNVVNPQARGPLLQEIRRELKPAGRVVISDIVADRPVPFDMQQDPELWSGCISGAWEEQDFLEALRSLGFEHVHYADRQE